MEMKEAMTTEFAIKIIENELKVPFGYNKEIVVLLRQGEKYKTKSERLEQINLNFTKWLDKNYKTASVNDIKKYWKKLIEDYVFGIMRKVIGELGEVAKKEER